MVERWNVDAITYPWHIGYTVFNDNPILYDDPLGLYGSEKKAERIAPIHRKEGLDDE